MPAINLNRRTALTALSATAVTTLAACASEPKLAETTPPSASVETQAPQNSGEQVVLGKTTDVPVGGGSKFPLGDLTILITQPAAGEFNAFDATCTHAGCVVNGIIDNEIACGCHGARFAMDSGMVLAGPAKSALGKLTVEVVGGDLVVTL